MRMNRADSLSLRERSRYAGRIVTEAIEKGDCQNGATNN